MSFKNFTRKRAYSLKEKKFIFDSIDWVDSRKDEISSNIVIKQINLRKILPTIRSHNHIEEKKREERKKNFFPQENRNKIKTK